MKARVRRLDDFTSSRYTAKAGRLLERWIWIGSLGAGGNKEVTSI